MKPITDKTILNKIVEELGEGEYNDEGLVYVTYEDDKKDIYIEASVRWQVECSHNWVNIDGCRYLEGVYREVVGFDDLEVDAWIGNEKVGIDADYIHDELYQYI